MEITFPKSRDVDLRNNLMKASEETLDAEIKRMSKKLNNRIARAKKANLDKYNPSAFKNIEQFLADTGLNSGSGKFTSSTAGMSAKEKASYLVKMFHFETYQLNISQLRTIKEKNREAIKKETGMEVSDEQMDRIGELMRDVYRASGDAGSLFREIFNSQDARIWATEHQDMTEEDVLELLAMIENIYDEERESGFRTPMQDIKDRIDAFKGSENNDKVVYGGVTFDVLTGHPVNEITGELLTDYTIDATSETLRDENEEIVNIDKYTGQQIPIKEFLEFIYGSITK